MSSTGATPLWRSRSGREGRRMARERTNVDSYTGQGGQSAVLSELLVRRCNAAVPIVDEGEDTLAFLPGQAEVTHIQVKTANAEPLKGEGRCAARVNVPLAQLRAERLTDLYYIFAVRMGERWTDFVILSREELNRLNRDEGVGYENQKSGELQLYLSFRPETLVCSDCD